MSVEDEAVITLSVSGSLTSSDPVIPKIAGLDIVQTGRSSRVQIINGSLSTVAEFTLADLKAYVFEHREGLAVAAHVASRQSLNFQKCHGAAYST